MSTVLARRVDRQFVLLGNASPSVVSIALFIPIRQGGVDHAHAVPMVEIDRRPS